MPQCCSAFVVVVVVASTLAWVLLLLYFAVVAFDVEMEMTSCSVQYQRTLSRVKVPQTGLNNEHRAIGGLDTDTLNMQSHHRVHTYNCTFLPSK